MAHPSNIVVFVVGLQQIQGNKFEILRFRKVKVTGAESLRLPSEWKENDVKEWS